MAGGMTLLGGRNAPPAVFQKNRDIAISLAAQGLSYARTGKWVGCVKSTVCQWLGKSPLAAPELPPDGTLEPDGLRTRTRSGRTELKVIRNAAAGTALGVTGVRKRCPRDCVIWRRGRWSIGLRRELERHNRELQRRERLGTVWTEHNLLALLQEQGLLNQTT